MIKYRLYQLKRWFGFFKFNFIRFFNKNYDNYYDDIKEIHLCFENLDRIIFERKYIGNFILDNIQTSISRIGMNRIDSVVYAKKFVLEVKKDANIFEKDINYGERYVFDRFIKYQDICNIEIIYKTGKQESYYFDYDGGEHDGDLGADNINQKSRINQFGDLEIVIDKDLSFDECFAYTQDEDNRNFMWDLYE